MAFSGGTFSRTFDCTTDRDNGVKILASKFDTELDGMATGLSTCILKDGTQTCTAAIPFAEGLTVPDNKTIILGTNSDIAIQYDESTNDSLEIAANVEGAALGIVLKADQGDDNADQHKVGIADGGTLTMASKISGSFVSYLTHTPNSTVASSTTAVAGNLTVGGDLTLGSGAVISEAELEAIDGVTAGTVTASKAVIVDSNKDVASFRNITLTGELDAGSLDVSGDADIDGTLEADAMTLNGTAITATATLDTGISNNNVPKFTSGVADNDFLRVDGTAIEGRSASEVLSDIAAAPAAGSSNIVTTGALNSGSITSGFGAIDNGSSNITTTGVGTFASLDISGDIDVDGTTNLDAVDIDGAVDINGVVHVSPNTAGKDTFELSTNAVDEGRLRIKNVDTTTVQIRAGGVSYFNGGNVGIGTTPDRDLHVKGASGDPVHFKLEGDASDYARIMFDDGTDDNIGEIRYDFSGDFMQFTTNASERMRLLNSGGLTFNGDTAAANALDDYEEGDWTPDIRQSGTAVSDAAYNTSFTGGQYTKIGRLVQMTCSIRLTDKGTVTASNGFQIGGLPFTSTNNVKARSAVSLYNHLGAGIDMTGNTNGTLMGLLSHNADEITFRVEDFSGTTGEAVLYEDVGDTLYLQLAFSFITG